MTYEIKNIVIEDKIITTEVEFTLSDGSVKTLTIPHFQPETREDVIVGIENNEICLEKDLLIPSRLEAIKTQLTNEPRTKRPIRVI